MAIQLKIDTVIGNINQLEQTLPLKVAAALYQEALVVQKESMKRTPVDTGALRASHETSPPRWKGDSLEVTIKVGGPAAGYAAPVHELTEIKHENGRAKFLESAVHEAASTLLERVAKRMKL